MRDLFHFYKNRPEWMSEFYNELQISLKDRKSLIAALAFVVLLIVSAIATHKSTNINDIVSLQNKRSDAILRELNDINSILHDVENNPLNNKQQQVTLQALQKDIASAQKFMTDVAKNSDIQKISTQLSSVKDDIDSQMSDLKKAVSKSVGSKEYLDASTLPFHVLSVDVIAGQPYASVEYAGHVSPLSIGDTLVGWRAITIDYNENVSEFVNDKNQYVKVSLQG
jgi:hypothetical protein